MTSLSVAAFAREDSWLIEPYEAEWKVERSPWGPGFEAERLHRPRNWGCAPPTRGLAIASPDCSHSHR